MGNVLKMAKVRPEMSKLKCILDLQVGDYIGLPVGEHKVYAQVVCLPHPTKPLIVYRILGAESVGVVNLKRAQVFKVTDASDWQQSFENIKDDEEGADE